MATMTATATPIDAAKERCVPAFENLEKHMREARRAIADGRHAAEDFVAETVREVRQHPLRALALAVGTGAVAGSLVGFALGRRRWTS
jgi:ElaB/YqjD/DUF883 family membrane-anchored ribosome-binding protein